MRSFAIVCVLFTVYSHLEGKARNWDTFDKHQLINAQVFQRKPCGGNVDVANDFLERINNVTVKTFKKVATVSNAHFVFSPFSLWVILASISEGSIGQTREELFKFLRMPQDECVRKQFYNLAGSLEQASEDVKLMQSSQLVFDDSIHLNADWESFIRRNTLLNVISSPLKTNPKNAAELIRKTAALQLPAPNFEGNSIVVDVFSYEGLWTNAFADAITERAPFFDDLGKKVGYVDLMKTKRRVRMAYIPSLNSKVLELPVGYGSRYRMVFALHIGTTQISKSLPIITDNVVFEVMQNLKESMIPLEIAIPRFRMTTEIDMRKILEDLGVKALWKDPEGTKNMSKPAAVPSSFIQRTTVTLDSTGIRPPIQEISNIVTGTMKVPDWAQEVETGLETVVGKEFIADRPFVFALFDSKTNTCLFSAVFSQPSYKN